MSTTQTHVNRRRAQRAEALQNQRARQQAAAARREREAQQREESTIMARTPRGNRRVSRDSFYGRRAVAQEAASENGTARAVRTAQPGSGSSATSAATATSATSASDSVQLSSAAQTSSNPFEGFAQGSSNVTVQSGDTLSALLMRQGYGQSEIYGENGALAQVMRANPSLRNPDLIFPDQQLRLPSRGESGATSAASSTPAASITSQSSNGNSVSDFLQQLTPQQNATSTQQQVPQNLDWLYLGQNYGNSTPDYSTSSFFA